VSCDVRIGTSGWHYKHWLGAFYPPGLPVSRMLAWYCERFDTVEINNTFYKLPAAGAVECWRDATPPGFVFAAKGSRFLTHMKKFKDAGTGLERFLERVELLQGKLGPILFQLPPHWGPDPGRLAEFLALLPAAHRYAFEFRNPGWFLPEILGLLERHRAACCAFDLGGYRSPVEVTADFAYVRLHGPGDRYQGTYSEPQLGEWARRIAEWRKRLKAIYVYFDNDQAGYAAADAAALIQAVRRGSV
jgi:uncharacterized protein YecE (DUF72 family)